MSECRVGQTVRLHCVSEDFVGDFPLYLLGWLDCRSHIARLDNQKQGAYKAWPIGLEELPMDAADGSRRRRRTREHP